MFHNLFKRAPNVTREWVTSEQWSGPVYAIGDVHGCLSLLLELEQQIEADARTQEGSATLIYLGDLIDRGPNSAGVLDHVLGHSSPLKRIALLGNHEAMMLEYVEHQTGAWLRYGGKEALLSYGVDVERFETLPKRDQRNVLISHIPDEHIAHLQNAPIGVAMPGATFVHAGLKPDVPLMAQREQDLIWIREPFLSTNCEHLGLVVHGHTPIQEAQVNMGRLDLDTGAFATGRLTGARIEPGRNPILFHTQI